MLNSALLDASVVIPTYNRRVILEKALQALFAQDYPADRYEVIVVDDGSTDGTEEMIRSLKPSCSFTYQQVERGGPGRARNIGIRLARGRYIIFIDSDIVVEPGFISSHLEAHRRAGENAIVHGQVIYTDNLENPTSAQWKLADISRAFFATTNASLAREKLIQAGLFDEEFKEYGWEDLELGLRLRKLGLRAVQCSSCRGYHYKSRVRVEALPALRQLERERGHTAVLFNRKHPTAEVRLMTLYHPFFFGLERVLSLGGWPDRPGTVHLLRRLEERGWEWPLRFLIRLIRYHAYFEGMREASE
ncbi:MAG: glycosyltransferase family A protein [Bacillota bacterium]|nr:glycosyltransferase family A protein [Bacillota bacterium]